MNNELILINVDDNYNQTVSGRELHEFLGINSNYTTWFQRMCEYGFTENADYSTCFPNLESENKHGGQNKIDHILTLNMAKELCMLARNEKGKQARQYFLEVEKDWNSPDKVMARALIMASHKIDEQQKLLQEQNKQLEEAKPKVIFADAVSASNSTMLVGELAKILKQNGVQIGANRLFTWLRDNGYLIKRKCSDYNKPTQKSMEMGLFEIKETTIMHSDGHTSVNTTSKLTGKGQQYFINKFLAAKKGGEVA